jgi:hypothetical protein
MVYTLFFSVSEKYGLTLSSKPQGSETERPPKTEGRSCLSWLTEDPPRSARNCLFLAWMFSSCINKDYERAFDGHKIPD